MLAPNGLNYELYQADRPTVVFLNGMSQSTLHWKSQARAFQSKFQVLCYDARGQGDSKIGEQDFTLQLHADDLAELLDLLSIERVHLVGFSHGARVALKFAADFPERSLSLVCCSASAKSSALARTIVRSWSEVLDRGGLSAMSWAALPAILGETFLRDNEHLLNGVIKASEQRNNPEGVKRLLRGMQEYPDLSELAELVRCSSLVISAENDPLVTLEGAQELAEILDGRHIEVKESGHTVPIEVPERFREIVLEFLAEVEQNDAA